VSNKFCILRVGTCNNKLFIKRKKKSLAYLDPQMVTRTNITLARKEIVAYFVNAMSHYKNKEMLIIPFNTGSHWVTLSSSPKYKHDWYCDSSGLIDPKMGD
jgi:hypothetical protein